ncbi:uncharacterized protein LOC135846810 [Planococcus citri]|uniref:uncharacterized protein LOC135846810 n=1 Tax=Planococcus citri TaxID=170843 RepID=UPI0031F727F4
MLRFNALLFLFLVHILFELGAAKPIAGGRDATIAETLSLIQEADQIIGNSTAKDAIIVHGISGVGKTPFTKWMTQDNAKLMSAKKNGSGPYLMKDNDNTIGKRILVSATIFPTLYVNASTNLAFYDFPGFEDTRGTNYDIATTYAAKGVVSKTKRTKLIFLVDYDTVKPIAGRTGFRDLLTYISKFVTDINKFKESVAIVVSKVPKRNDDDEVVSDEQVIKDVVKFIQEEVLPIFQTESENINLSDEKKTFYAGALSFIRIILTQTDGDYMRIGLFRLPDRAGPFSNISLVQNGKKRIEQIIRKLNFTEVTANDFNYVIPDEATINLNKIAQEINRNISSVIEEIGKNITSLILAKEQNISTDITKLRNEIHAIYKGLSNAQILANNSNIERCVELVEEHTANLRDFSLSAIKSYVRFLLFLQNVSGKKIARSNENCFQGLETTAIRYLDESLKWYTFLTNVYDSLSDYAVQKDLTTCKNVVPNVNINEGENQSTIRDKLSSFFKACVINNREYDHLHGIHLDASKLKALNRILNYTLRHSSNLSCDPENPEKLVLKGRYVKFSDIVNSNVKCSKPIKIMEVFAFNKVFIDASLNKTGAKLRLSILAPIWDIQLEQKIILDGLPGKAHKPTQASSAVYRGGNGANGKAGLPGNSAGSFLGIGEIFLNVEKLTISANGGDGGAGQHGGDGGNGENGITPTVDSVTLHESYVKEGSLESTRLNGLKDRTWLRKAYPKKNCTYGGNGGAGGKGGYGGQPGVFFIPLIRNVPIPHILNKTGNTGPAGVGGRGGNAGEPGKVLFALYITYDRSPCFGCSSSKYELVNTTDLLLCADGAPGNNGTIESNATSETKVSFSKFISTINDYKNYLRGDMIDGKIPVNDTFLENFHNLLENSTHTYYDTSAFINELYNLERQFITIKD